MKKLHMGSAIFTGLFVGVITFVKELFFPDISFLMSIIIIVVAATIGFLLGERIFTRKKDQSG